MSQYKNDPARFATFQKRILIKVVPLMLLTAIAALSILYFSTKNSQSDVYTWLLVLVVVASMITYAIISNSKRQKEIYDSYRLITAADYLSRQQNGLPLITLFFSEITQITEDNYGNLLIKGQNTGQYIVVSAFIENYDEVKSLLQTAHPITPQDSKNILQKYSLILPVMILGLMAAVYISHNKIIVGVSGIILVLCMIWSSYKIRQSTQIDSRVKQSAWWLLVVIISMILIIYYKVFGS